MLQLRSLPFQTVQWIGYDKSVLELHIQFIIAHLNWQLHISFTIAHFEVMINVRLLKQTFKFTTLHFNLQLRIGLQLHFLYTITRYSMPYRESDLFAWLQFWVFNEHPRWCESAKS